LEIVKRETEFGVLASTVHFAVASANFSIGLVRLGILKIRFSISWGWTSFKGRADGELEPNGGTSIRKATPL
jgi:hypothetical protein